MGIAKNQAHEARDKKRRRGSVNNKGRLDDFGGGGTKGSADWSACDCRKLLDVVVMVTELGGAVTIGMSRDQGAHSLTLMLDGDRRTLWFNGDADLDARLLEVIEKLRNMG